VIHVTDLARALAEIPLDPRTAGQTYFVADGTPRSFGEIFEKGRALSGRSTRLLRLPALAVRAGRQARRFLPFALGCLLADVLVCRDRLLGELGLRP